MRAQAVLLSLIATPFVVTAAQDRARYVRSAEQCVSADEHRSSNSYAPDRRPEQALADRRGCSPAPPAPPPPPPPPPPPSGSISITGRVYNDIVGRPGLSGWVVEVSGASTGSAVTDANGNYTVSGLAAGTLQVCERVPDGWRQTVPSSGVACPTGVGYRFTLATGQAASFVNFGNASP